MTGKRSPGALRLKSDIDLGIVFDLLSFGRVFGKDKPQVAIKLSFLNHHGATDPKILALPEAAWIK